MSALCFDSVSRHFGDVRALDGVSLTVDAGETLCLLGPSGCGKSTLLRVAAGLERIDGGAIHIGKDCVNRNSDEAPVFLPPEQRDAGFVFQDFALFPHLSCRDNVGFGLLHLPEKTRHQRALAALTRVGMAASANAYPHTLSGGQQQRVALARAMAPEPALFLLDEPFSGLDRRLRYHLAQETWHLLRESGVATIIVTHDPEEAMFMGDRIAVMRAGKIEQIGAPSQLYQRPESAFVANFLSESNQFTAQVDDNGRVQTPLGFVAARASRPGDRVDVVIRYEGLTLCPPDDIATGDAQENGQTVLATVLAARPLGPQTLVFLAVKQASGPDVQACLRMVSGGAPVAGARVGLKIDASQAFVFPAAPAT